MPLRKSCVSYFWSSGQYKVLMSPFTLEVYQEISIDLLRVNSRKIYVFEDTLDCSGSSGSAKVRHEPNASGIPGRRSRALSNGPVHAQNCRTSSLTTLGDAVTPCSSRIRARMVAPLMPHLLKQVGGYRRLCDGVITSRARPF
jgi:hypothetical protein